MELTQKELKSKLNYNPKTGIFTWKVDIIGNGGIGSIAGNITNTGYWQIGYKQKRYLAHRLIWLYVHGKFPEKFIDHINHDGNDNRLVNLREASSKDNQRNMKKHKSNTSGFCGVSLHNQTKKWRAYICINDKHINLGHYEEKEEAIKARMEANKIYGFHENHGK